MAFKLPMQNKLQQNTGRFTHSSEEAAPGTPIIRKDLSGGVMAEANEDGSIFVSTKLVPGSEEEKAVLIHEMQHITDMKVGKLKYTDDVIMWNGNNYQRLPKGKIMFEGTKYNEGDKRLPWEAAAM
tara:strand:+ start:112 stop:489 length:378 start_codon:yes stop_codon:yes gene_type:complete